MKRFSVFPVMLVFLLTLGLAFTACDNGSTGGGNKFLGLPYSVKFDHKDNFGGELTTYILECSYDEAFEILTQKFGRWHEQVSAQGFWFLPNNDFINYLAANPDYVMLQDCVDFGEYRLVHKYRPDDPNDDESDGFNWYKPYERQGTLRITGIPAQYEGKEVGFHIFGWLYYDYVVTNLWDETFYYLYDDLPKVSNGSAALPLWWFPVSKKYDRNGIYNHGESYRIYLFIDVFTTSAIPYRIPTITFNKGSAELDFNIAEEDPAYEW